MVYFNHSRQSKLAIQKKFSRVGIFLKLCLMILLIALLDWFACDTADAQGTRIDSSDQPTEVFPIDLNLRIVWGGEKSASYVATIELDSGNLYGTQQLGIDANDSSFILKDSNGRLAIDDRETRFGGCDIRVQAKSNSRLKLQLQISDPGTAQAITKDYSWTLKTLRDTPDLQELGFNDCRLSIDRVPGDRLRVVTSRSHLIYNSDEPLNIQIQPYGLPWFSTTGNLECSLVRLDDEHQVFRKSRSMALDGRGHGEIYDVVAAAPKEEGVYELRFKIEPKRVLPGIIIRHPSIERVVQFVVYNHAPTNHAPTNRSANTKSQRVDEETPDWLPLIQIPLKSFESQSLTSLLLSQIDGSRRFPFFDMARSFSILPKELHAESILDANESHIQIAPGALAVTSINGLVPGQLHRLTVSSSNRNATFRVALLQTGLRDQKSHGDALVNEVYDESSIGSVESAVNRKADGGAGSLEVLFWPNSRSARLEITNLNTSRALPIAATFVDAWHEAADVRNARPIAAQPIVSKSNCNVLELHSASVRNLFGSDSTVNAGSNSPTYDDWRLFLRFATQVGDYCKANGYDALAMTVHTDGGTLFPSSTLSSNARFDTGTFSTNGRDPFRKDIVELLYRALLRSGIEFVPMIELNSPLRDVEESLSKIDGNELLQYREGSSKLTEPYIHLYNPFSLRVQQSIATALDEFEGRYSSHPNYRGFALRATTPSHLDVSVPIDQTNMAILDKFSNAMGGGLPKDTSQRQQLISQRFQSAYSQWLKGSVADFLAKLKTRPRWLSVGSEQAAVQFGSSLSVVSPISMETPSQDPSRLLAMIEGQWSLESPRPIHVAMDRPVYRFDSSVARLAKIAKPFQAENIRSLPYRDQARTASKIRIWISNTTGNSLLISNSGAVSESLHFVWNRLPVSHQIVSSLGRDSSASTRVEYSDASLEWLIQVSAGEVVRVDFHDDTDLPMYWYVDEMKTLQTLDVALHSLEKAVSRLSIPMPRAATLTNSSFESQSATYRRGRLLGWTTSIAPNASVDIDSRIARDGRASIRIEGKNSSSIAWIQSDPFALTPSDRLFVSFQCAAEQIPQQLNLSLSKFDLNSDRFETVAVRDLSDRIQQPNVQTNWGNVGVDLSSEFQKATQGNDATLFRLQFEVKGQGRLWLDDVSLSTTFLRDGEQRDLRSELFLARTSLQHGDSGPAVAMLTSPHGRLIQWGDSTANDRKLMTSVRVGKTDPVEAKQRSSDNQTKSDLRVDAKENDTKQRPVKALRNYWWLRKQ